MPIIVKKRERENISSLLFRFNKRIKQSGLLKEAKKRRFHHRPINRNKRRKAALYKLRKTEEIRQSRKRYV